MSSFMNNQTVPVDGVPQYAIILLKPKPSLHNKLASVAPKFINLPIKDLKTWLEDCVLADYTVPVCVPMLKEPKDLEAFISANSRILFDIMLTAWQFPISSWDFDKKNNELFHQFVDTDYFPLIAEMTTTAVQSTLDLTVVRIKPTTAFTEHIEKLSLSDHDRQMIYFYSSIGFGMLANTLKRAPDQPLDRYIMALNDPKSALAPFKNTIVKTLFSFFLTDPSQFPAEQDDAYLNKWFEVQGYLGLYKLTDPSAQARYITTVAKSQNQFKPS